ncbi:glycerol dehydratase reactivase beta/small subunit family protein [Aneurinibacillus aneurinilyticus]|uniref:glycerol dehydratase reactivase beta/small subunit family protein n=1 Tax=Aneurinibacillus aneurinilyticus TaxID=1391 RepID=UPI0035238775
MKQKIGVSVLYEKGTGEEVLDAIFAGLEEEGVPFFHMEGTGCDACELGRYAAALSLLDVGIGVEKQGGSAICHIKLARGSPYLFEPVNGRTAGQNAARLVKGMPFKSRKEDEENEWTDIGHSKRNDRACRARGASDRCPDGHFGSG